jgi:hypothetical protein
MQRKLLGIISVDFDAADHLLIIYSVWQIFEKKKYCQKAVHQLFIDFREANVSVRREVLYKILIQFVIIMKPVRLMKCA